MKALNFSIAACAVLFLVGISSQVLAQKTDEFHLDQTYAIDQNGTISLNSDDADLVEIVGTDRSDVHVVIDYELSVEGLRLGDRDEFDMEISERNGNLEISERPQSSNFNINFGVIDEDYTIRIETPRGVSLDLEGDDDNYEISQINGSITIDADDAEIRLEDCEGDSFEFDLDDGELDMNGGRGLLSIDFDDGDADVRNGQFSRVNVDMDDADIYLATTLADDGDYDFNTDDGSIDLTVLGGGGEFWVDHDEIRVSASNDFEEIRSGETYNEYRLPGGNAQVRIDTDDGRVRLSTN